MTLADGREFDAKLVGADADSDLAVLRIQAGERLPTAPLGTSSDLLIGETVIAIGNPFGLSHTVTTGVVSARSGRSLRGEDRDLHRLRADRRVDQPRQLGRPALEHPRGEVIGINAAIYGKAQGIGFAIPIDRAKRVLRELVSYGEVKRTWIGVFTQDLTPELARHLGARKGVIVATVEPKSPAAAAASSAATSILKIDGREIASPDEFEGRIADHQAGDDHHASPSAATRTATIREVTVRVTARSHRPTPTRSSWSLIGFAGRAGPERRHGRDEGAAGAAPCARIGLKRGDRILGLGGRSRVVDRGAAAQDDRVARRARSVVLTVGRGPYEY